MHINKKNISIVTTAENTEYVSFDYCMSLKYLSLANALSFESYLFSRCPDLISVEALSLKYIGESVFQNCMNLERITFPNVTEISEYAFSCCSRLELVDFPLLKYCGSHSILYVIKVN